MVRQHGTVVVLDGGEIRRPYRKYGLVQRTAGNALEFVFPSAAISTGRSAGKANGGGFDKHIVQKTFKLSRCRQYRAVIGFSYFEGYPMFRLKFDEPRHSSVFGIF